ncbi:MAG: aminotransferase class I/II-fold pyridoxal phosphate-dependent enzyme [Andreesenia angusta]|nr:aminotransferase class I/II-fold pyridoxal phosphate-dependent enzyme [Andreesenia angusta]
MKMEENRKIMEFLRDYDNKKSIRFHMPGHKGKNMSSLKEIFPSLDITEINGSDNLHFPNGIIRNSERRAAKAYGAKETLFMVNGSTSSIYTAINGVVAPGEKILIQRDSHKAAYNALLLGGIEAEYIYPEYDEELQMNLGLLYEKLENKLKRYLLDNKIKAIFLTHPNYYGVSSDLEKIIELAHIYDKIVIVDEAHGSHLLLDDRLPKSAIEYGADIVIHSIHKTMVGLTQTSLLHICSNRVDIEKIRSMARIYQSSSPSYLLMASLDLNTEYILKDAKKDMKNHIDRLQKLIYSDDSNSVFNKELFIINEDIIKKKGFNFDLTKIIFSMKNYSGKFIEQKLREEYNIEIEMSDHRYGVAISTLVDEEKDLKRLIESLKSISTKIYSEDDILYRKDNIEYAKNILNDYEKPLKKMSIREAFYSEKEEIDYLNAIGRIAGDIIAPYPPGIPILTYGEEISEKIVKKLEYIDSRGINIEGMNDKKIKLIME